MNKRKLRFENMPPFAGPANIELIIQARPAIMRGDVAVAHGEITESDSYLLEVASVEELKGRLEALAELMYSTAPASVLEPPRTLRHGEHVEMAVNFLFRKIVLG